ncbi:bucentaur or craniofacial development-domain-containing protein [Lentinula aciculospora]|uniref:SWR1-complex protein 5 n=1 Tax=Lentinula aciculospora TaxID=153920 RepID=A0A9W9DG09_9AGAR|nr:bucentaur or craniofacial development-domain-containing protein [Lentinula aciculospora]
MVLPSDSEDGEYVPDEKADSYWSSDSETEGPNTKRPRTEPSELEDTESQQRKRKELWKAFQESVASSKDLVAEEKPKSVRVEKRYLFAGKEITEIVEVSADSAEAKKWPMVSSETPSVSSSSRRDSPSSLVHKSTASSIIPTTFQAGDSNLLYSQSSQKPIAPRRGPRKSKITLSEVPGSSAGTRLRATKLTTLEKSAMDWRSHVSEQDHTVKNELEANRKHGGGGYLEKVEFLERVSERRESLLDASKSGKRRRG